MKLNTAKASPETLMIAAKKLIAKGQVFEAADYLHEILRRDERNHAAMFLLAGVYGSQEMLDKAINFYLSAIKAAPEELSYKQGFVDFIGLRRAAWHSQPIDDALVSCLKEGQRLDFSRLQSYWFDHITTHPAFHAAIGLKDLKPFDPANKAHFEKLSDYAPLFTPCFLLGVKNFIVYKPQFEEFITHARGELLAGRFTPEETLALADAIAHYSFNTDFILDITDEEQKKVDALRARLEGGQGEARDVALFACYAPLYALKNADDILRAFSSAPSLGDILQTQIADYNRLKGIAASVPAATPIDAASGHVQEQYEEFPYPRWNAFSLAAWARGWDVVIGDQDIAEFRRRKLKILNAGCGTGSEAVSLASLFPRSQVLAVDLSRASLAYATVKAEEYGLENVTFRHADILNLGALDEKFDYISSVGVLHHMKNPVAGWRVLCDLLRPNGLMTIGLYSKIARADVIKTQDIARDMGYTGTADSMKSFRRKSPHILDEAMLKNVSFFTDYYSLSMYRDLLFHVQEHDYDLPEIAGILKELNLEFIGFERDSVLMDAYARRFPGDPAMTNLGNWDILEHEKPEAFKFMYVFWCRKR